MFYRASLCERARMLEIAGWVKNRPDGSVEAVAEGVEGPVTLSVPGWDLTARSDGAGMGDRALTALVGAMGVEVKGISITGVARLPARAGLGASAAMAGAVATATAIARESTPATVLLSPAAASFDMFRDYEARGAAFKAAVAALPPGEAGA